MCRIRAPVIDNDSASDAIPAHFKMIEIRVAELKQLFNSIDPSPFRDRDLDPKAEEFIMGWARELPHDAQLGLLVHLDRAPGRPDEAVMLREAVHEFFSNRALDARRRLRALLSRGRTSLVIGLAFLGAFIGIGNLLLRWMGRNAAGEIVRESLTIGGWVALWRPLEVFLYDWWPIRAEARLFERLATMPVRIKYLVAGKPDITLRDWPATASPGYTPMVGSTL